MGTFRLKPAARDLLLAMKDATATSPFHIADTSAEAVKDLIKPDRILIYFDNGTKKVDPATKVESVYAVPSPMGLEKIASYRLPDPNAKPRGPLPNPDDFVIETDVPIPDRTRTNVGRPVYPFDKMQVGNSFFIPPSDTTSDPVKSKQSSITAQNRRSETAFQAAKAAGSITDPNAVAPKWRIAPDTKTIDGVEIKGARVFRIV